MSLTAMIAYKQSWKNLISHRLVMEFDLVVHVGTHTLSCMVPVLDEVEKYFMKLNIQRILAMLLTIFDRVVHH